ncbi:MAG: hypothetical protein KBS89_06925 [Bacteroidales bacterium]|nr:hypothetical protein [Candidatus Egerieousia equi]
MKKLLFILTLLLVFTTGYARNRGYYKVTLSSVEGTGLEGAITNSLDVHTLLTMPEYIDSNMIIHFTFEPTHIDFDIYNCTKANMKIIWDEIVYVGGVELSSASVFHKGIKIIDREKPQTPTTILKETKYTDILILKSSVEWDSFYGRWMYYTILFGRDKMKEIKLLMPIMVGDTRYEYLFNFKVEWQDIKVKSRIYDGKEYYIQIKK